MVITFSEDATTATFATVLSSLGGWTVEVKSTNPGYPDEGTIVTADEQDGLKVYEVDESGAAITNSSWWIPWEALESVVIV